MNTDKDLKATLRMGRDLCNWQTHVLEEVDIDYVIWYLLKEQFIVEIEGHKYDIMFGKNRKGEIGRSISMHPSPVMCSYEIINKGFRTGKWYRVTSEKLTQEEIDKHIKDMEEQDQRKHEEWLQEVVSRLKPEQLRLLEELKKSKCK